MLWGPAAARRTYASPPLSCRSSLQWPLPPSLAWLLSMMPPSTPSSPLLATADTWKHRHTLPHQQLSPYHMLQNRCRRCQLQWWLCRRLCGRQHLRFQRLSGQHLNNCRHLHTLSETASQLGWVLCLHYIHQKYYHHCWFCHFYCSNLSVCFINVTLLPEREINVWSIIIIRFFTFLKSPLSPSAEIRQNKQWLR